MKAARLHRYEERPVIEEVAEPEATGSYDVVVRIGGAGLLDAGRLRGRGILVPAAAEA
jgi:D-arabinose 1-dehydrogenase-like Zn-dependent alcohol dehydrogenase